MLRIKLRDFYFIFLFGNALYAKKIMAMIWPSRLRWADPISKESYLISKEDL
jgi:hypothetical protein